MTTSSESPDQQQTSTASTIVPRLVRSLSKAQATIQSTPSSTGVEGITSSVSRLTKPAIDKVRHLTRQETWKTPQFPPSSWFEGKAINWTILDSGPSQSSSLGQSASDVQVNDGQVNDDPGEDADTLEPTKLAKKIRDMIGTIPSLPSTISASASRLRPTSLPPPDAAVDGAPTPPPPPPISDSNLLAFLSSSNIMNGSIERGRQSVWSALDRLRPPYGKRLDVIPSPEREHMEDAVLDCVDDNNSVMMYGPLEPDDSSEVEIACSEIVSVNGDGEEIRTPQPRFIPLPSESIEQVLMSGSDSSVGKGSESDTGHQPETSRSMGEQASSAEAWEAHTPVKEYRVWLPSLTKISVQTMWWGFRIYLPPPVLDVLNNKQLEAAKRAAMITTALKWLLDHLPVPLLPAQMRPAVAILRRLVPYLGYMGGFIAWSWSAIKSFDKGYGVVLTATWILPFALIPGTWEADQVPTMDMFQDPQPSTSTSQ